MESGLLSVCLISRFGLPSRPAINANFYTMAMQNGLTAGIINPSSEDMMRSYHSYCALMNYDTNCENYIAHYGNQEPVKTAVPAGQQIDLKTAIAKRIERRCIPDNGCTCKNRGAA